MKSLEEENIIKDIRNPFRPKKKLNYAASNSDRKKTLPVKNILIKLDHI